MLLQQTHSERQPTALKQCHQAIGIMKRKRFGMRYAAAPVDLAPDAPKTTVRGSFVSTIITDNSLVKLLPHKYLSLSNLNIMGDINVSKETILLPVDFSHCDFNNIVNFDWSNTKYDISFRYAFFEINLVFVILIHQGLCILVVSI